MKTFQAVMMVLAAMRMIGWAATASSENNHATLAVLAGVETFGWLAWGVVASVLERREQMTKAIETIGGKDVLPTMIGVVHVSNAYTLDTAAIRKIEDAFDVVIVK